MMPASRMANAKVNWWSSRNSEPKPFHQPIEAPVPTQQMQQHQQPATKAPAKPTECEMQGLRMKTR